MGSEFLWKRHKYLSRMLEKVKYVNGDIVECGIGSGKSFLILSHLLSRTDSKRLLWGFDSFEGFPEPTKEDSSPALTPQYANQLSVWGPEQLYSYLGNQGVNSGFLENQIRLVKGFFDQTLIQFPAKPIALLHIDADLYQSYRDSLNILFPKVAPGGLVLFDEYKCIKWVGAKKAVDEYFANTHYKIEKDHFSGKYFVIKA